MKGRIIHIFMVAALAVTLWGCSGPAPKPTESPVTELTLTVSSAEELAQLDDHPNLQKVDLRGSTCYDAILGYISAHPQVEVLYDVSLGGVRWTPDTTELELSDGSFTPEELTETLRYLPRVTSISLPCTSLDTDTIASLKEALNNVSVAYTVDILGTQVPSEADVLDLSGLLPEQVADTAEKLALLPGLTRINLMDENDTSALSVADVKLLMDAAPNAVVDYSFQLYGVTIRTTDERVEFINTHIGNEGVDQVREALSILPNCTYLLMDTCGVDNEVMAQMREDYAETTKVVWRVWLVEEDYSSRLYLRTGSYLTDTHKIRTTYVNDENSHVLNYCTETKYVDVGHVWQLTQCEFLAYMPDLEVCIIAITEITDITPLANHEKLEYLELFTTDIADISPLLSCPNIEHLNLSNMPYLDDITPVFSLKKLKRLRMVDSPLISDEEKRQAKEALPDCNHMNMGHFATAWGWRYLDPQKENPDPRYALLCEQMEYEIDAWEYGIP